MPMSKKNKLKLRNPEMVFQNEVAECGLACISMFSETLGYNYELSELRVRFPTTSSGLSLMEMVDILSELSIPSLPVKFDVKKMNDLPFPAILHFGGNHFVYISERNGDYIRLFNPASGMALVRVSSMEEYFTGYAIILDKCNYINHPATNVSIKRKENFISKIKTPFLKRILAGSVIVGLISFIMPLLFSHIMDNRGENINIEMYYSFLIVLMAVFISAVLELALTKLSIKQMSITSRGYIPGLFNQLMTKKMTWFEVRDASDINQRLSSISRVISQRGRILNTLSISLLSAILSITIMFWLHPLLGSIALTVIIIYGLINTFFARSRESIFHSMEKSSADLNEFTYETINNIALVKSAELYKERCAKFAAKNESVINKSNDLQLLSAKQSISYKLLANIENVLMLAIAMYLFTQSKLTVGELFAFAMFKHIALGSSTDFYMALINIKEHRVMAKRATELLTLEPVATQARVKLKKFNSLKCVETVFSYQVGKPVLMIPELFIQSGDKIALTGISGSGKSSLLKILYGWQVPEVGNLYIDDVQYNWSDLQHLAFYLRPEDTLLHASIINNVNLYGDHDQAQKALKVIEELDLMECISRLPHGLNTNVSHNNPLISDGQQQRLLLARAICSNKPILLLDEPTANLDKKNSLAAIDCLINCDKTIVVALHDMSLLSKFDKVIHISEGQLKFSSANSFCDVQDSE